MQSKKSLATEEEILKKESMLPAVITKVTVQARDASRASLFIGDAFFYGFYRDSLRKRSVSEGTRLTVEEFRILLSLDESRKVDNYIAKLLGNRDHSTIELKRKATQKKFNPKIIEEVLNLYSERGFISDVGYAKKFIQNKRSSAKWGDLKIKAELLKKGVPPKVIDEALSDLGAADEKAFMLQLVEKKKATFKRENDIGKRRKKIFDHLARKGFQPGTILQYLDTLIQELEN